MNKILYKNQLLRSFLKLRFDMKLFVNNYNDEAKANTKSKFSITYHNDIKNDIGALMWLFEKQISNTESKFMNKLMNKMNKHNLSASDINPLINYSNSIINSLQKQG